MNSQVQRLPGYWIKACTPPFLSNMAIFCTGPKAENTYHENKQTKYQYWVWPKKKKADLTKNFNICCVILSTMCKTSKVTAYCIFSIDARRTLLSGSSFFPSKPIITCNYDKIILFNQTKNIIHLK